MLLIFIVWLERHDSNVRPADSKSVILPLNYSPMVVLGRIELPHKAYETSAGTIRNTNSVFNCTITSAASAFSGHSLSSGQGPLDYCACENRVSSTKDLCTFASRLSVFSLLSGYP